MLGPDKTTKVHVRQVAGFSIRRAIRVRHTQTLHPPGRPSKNPPPISDPFRKRNPRLQITLKKPATGQLPANRQRPSQNPQPDLVWKSDGGMARNGAGWTVGFWEFQRRVLGGSVLIWISSKIIRSDRAKRKPRVHGGAFCVILFRHHHPPFGWKACKPSHRQMCKMRPSPAGKYL